ncbi:hypothetical protein DFP72DRAFT_855283 [Ephemerocybe angulata]|uniref:Uncharacterized protein n=1 Tax=Ephemerocybe angulata TaxID=980116 RepID=A0A8H6HI23_9AGAR|nr:hypothetical protein DFP72DRAFT_855283 [Tulosesus angulatus]
MFPKDYELVVLLQVTDSASEGVYLGYCEGVISKFNSKKVQFLTNSRIPLWHAVHRRHPPRPGPFSNEHHRLEYWVEVSESVIESIELQSAGNIVRQDEQRRSQ